MLDQIAALEASQRHQWMMNAEAQIIAGRARESQELNGLKRRMEDEQSRTAVSRDILGEMVLAALIMITGGEPKEEDRIRRAIVC